MNQLRDISTDDLKKEIQIRENILKYKEQKQQQILIDSIIKHRHILKQFMQHDRNSCKKLNNDFYNPIHDTFLKKEIQWEIKLQL